MIPEFSHQTLDLGILYGTLGGPEYSTLVRPLDSGFEGRFARTPRGRWQLGDTTYTETEWEYLKTFFWQHRGAAVGFWWRDWSDYKVVDGLIGVGDGTTTRFPLVKTYPGGYTKTIFNADPDTFTATVEDLEIRYVLNANNREVVFEFAPDEGLEITASFEFEKPVRFEQDSITSRFDAYSPDTGAAFYFVDNLPIVELYSAPGVYPVGQDLFLDYLAVGNGEAGEQGLVWNDGEIIAGPVLLVSEGWGASATTWKYRWVFLNRNGESRFTTYESGASIWWSPIPTYPVTITLIPVWPR